MKVTCAYCSKETDHIAIHLATVCEVYQRVISDRFLENEERRSFQEWLYRAERSCDRAWELNR